MGPRGWAPSDAAFPRPDTGGPATPFDAHLAAHRDWAGDNDAPPETLHRALMFWTRLHGALSLELSGHFTGMGIDPAQLYAAEVDAMAQPGNAPTDG